MEDIEDSEMAGERWEEGWSREIREGMMIVTGREDEHGAYIDSCA